MIKPVAARGASQFLPPEKFTTPIQWKAHIKRLQKVPITQRQAGYAEALVTTADKILDSKPPESLREFAVLNLLDGLHQWADADKNAEADKRLDELATKYASDSNKKIATAAAFYVLEQRVLKPGELKPDEIPKLLEEVKAALNGKALNARHLRIANGTVTLINYLPTDEEAEKQFKVFSHIFTASTDQAIGRLGNQLRTQKRDPSVIKVVEKPVEAAPVPEAAALPQTAAAEPAAMPPPVKIEPAADWVKHMEAKLATLSGNAHDEEYQREKAAFMEKYPIDPLRWHWNIMDARRAMSSDGSREERTQIARAALNAVVVSDAPEELREQASSMNLKLDIYNAQPMADLVRDVAEHLARFPESKLQAALMQSLVAAVAKGQSDEQALARLEELKQSGVVPLAAAAEARIGELHKQSKTTPAPTAAGASPAPDKS